MITAPASASAGRVTSVPAADPVAAADHFARRLANETDPSDVHDDLVEGLGGFVVIDTRSPEAYARSHIPGAVNLPHRAISPAAVADVLPEGAVAVTYCWGPHCNAATKGALALARLARPVKEMVGGIEGWEKDGYRLVTGPDPGVIGRGGE